MNFLSLLSICIFSHFIPHNRRLILNNSDLNEESYLLVSTFVVLILTIIYTILFGKFKPINIEPQNYSLILYNSIITIIQTLVLYKINHKKNPNVLMTWTIMSLIVSYLISIYLGDNILTQKKCVSILLIIIGVYLLNK
jgi:uncharacterized membrane protein